MKGTINIKELSDPILLDQAFDKINKTLLDKLQWLDNAFLKVEKRKEDRDNGEFIYPVVYTGRKNEYISLFPNEDYGCFSYFDTALSDTVKPHRGLFPNMETEFGLIMWFDYRKIFSEGHYSLENVKGLVLDVLKFIPNITLTDVGEDASEVYSGYSYDQLKNQFQMRPYGILRFNGTITYKKNCK